MQCILARLNEPNIARKYPVEPGQNLINNIRVLCTRQPGSFRYFVPEEMFHDIRNGYAVPIKAVCCDEDGTWFLEIDPLKVLSEQLRAAGVHLYSGKILEIRIGVEGHELPSPGDTLGFLKRNAAPLDESRKITPGSRAGTSWEAGQARRTGGPGYKWEAGQARRPAGRSKDAAGILRMAALTAAAVFLITALLLFAKDSAVKRFEKELDNSDYAAAVRVYNEKISGRETREEKAAPRAQSEVESIESGYLSGRIEYEQACSDLGLLSGIRNDEISQMAQSALQDVELNESASAAYSKGMASLEEKDYIGAIRAFLEVPAQSAQYEDAQDSLQTCAERVVRSAGSIKSEEEYPDALAMIDSAISLLPENETLTAGKESCRRKYKDLVRSNAVTQADEMAAEGDYAGAYDRITRAQEILPDDEKLAAKRDEIHSTYVNLVTREAASCVDSGNWDGAREAVSNASELYPCEEFDSLSAQIGDAQQTNDADPIEYAAPEVEFTTFKGTVKAEGGSVRHAVRAAQTGDCRFNITKLSKGFKVKIVITGPDGEELVSETGLSSGGGVTCRLEKGKKYTVEVFGEKGKGSYVLTLGQPGETLDVSQYDVILDSTQFKDQLNVYRFEAANNGIYRFDITETSNNAKLAVTVCDSLGYTVCSAKAMAGGDGLTAELSAGGVYEIRVRQASRLGTYTMKIGRQAQTQDVTGKSILSGNVSFEGQKNVCNYTAADSGRYAITPANMPASMRARLLIYDSLGYKVGGDDDPGNGESVEVEFTGGQTYQIQFIGTAGTGDYTLTIVKLLP